MNKNTVKYKTSFYADDEPEKTNHDSESGCNELVAIYNALPPDKQELLLNQAKGILKWLPTD